MYLYLLLRAASYLEVQWGHPKIPVAIVAGPLVVLRGPATLFRGRQAKPRWMPRRSWTRQASKWALKKQQKISPKQLASNWKEWMIQ